MSDSRIYQHGTLHILIFGHFEFADGRKLSLVKFLLLKMNVANIINQNQWLADGLIEKHASRL